MTVQVDRYTKAILTIITIMLILLVIGVWTMMPSTLPRAEAALPDSGQQLETVITELQGVQTKIDRIYDLLNGGKVKVQIVESSDKATRP